MKTISKQVVYIIASSIVISALFNYLRPTGIPIVAKQINGFSGDDKVNEFIVEIIDLKLAKAYFYDGVIFVDARDFVSFSDGHITNAVSAFPYDEMVDNIFITYGFNKPVVVYCDDAECGLSEDLAYKLQADGFSKIYVFSGGWNQWLNAKLPVTN